MTHLPIPILRCLALAVAILPISLTTTRSASAEATLIVEADSGKVLHAEHATFPWYPASTTKLMTMYLTLKAVKDKRLTLDSLLTVSSNAVAQAPSKMGFKAGTTVTVDNALKMLMVKSANDMAVVLAEGVSGSIEKFADDMNAASRRLGMTQSSWVNPNGLPADEQITSARDMAMLARAILKELPEYESFWHIPSIKFGKRIMRNTNGLIGRYPDADGMKTGFICASGFNVVASATRNGRKLIVVVFGSRSGMVRSEKAAQLFEKGFASGGLSWLMPSLGTVDALQPVAAAPPNLRDEMCGKNRKRPAAEDEDDDDTVQASSDVDQSSAFAMTANSLRERKVSGPILGPLQASVPVNVYIGPARGDAVATQIAVNKRRKGGAATESAEVKPDEKPKTANASAGFNLTPNLRLPGSRFTPAAAESKPAPAPSGAAAPRAEAGREEEAPREKARGEKDRRDQERRGEIHQAMSPETGSAAARPRGPLPPIPLNLITGFLGAGKTTLLNRLLRDPALAQAAVIINEFGEIGLDHLLVEHVEDGVMLLATGCLCCTVRGDLVNTLEKLLRGLDNGRMWFNRVIIETTGLADPAPVLHTIMVHPYMQLRFRLDGVATLVDAVNGAATLDAHIEARKQAAVADRIVLTKTDLVDTPQRRDALAALRARLAALNPAAPVIEVDGRRASRDWSIAGSTMPSARSPT